MLHFAAIGIVTSLSEEACKSILTDVFSALVELSRRTGKEARLHFKGVGFLHLFMNRDLSFQPVDKFSELTEEMLREKRNEMRDDISYIDGASAVLSRGQGSAFSVRSQTLSKLSVKTPLSKFSDNVSRFSSNSRLSTMSANKNNGQLPHVNVDPVW